MTHTTFKAKNTTFPISYQVRQILNEKGFSFLFNWSDYAFYKSQAKNAFDKAQAIAELFIEETNAESDFNEYVF